MNTDANGRPRHVWLPPDSSSSVVFTVSRGFSLTRDDTPSPTSRDKVIQSLITLNVYTKDPCGDTTDGFTDHYRVIKLDISKELGE